MQISHLQQLTSVPIDQGLLNQAVGFFNAASRCFADVQISPLIKNAPMTPGVVCIAFSIELYLKLMLLLSNVGPKRLHKIDELYAELPDSFKQRLAAQYGKPDLVAQLSAMSSAFVDWRYAHEHVSLVANPMALMEIARACHLVVRESKPAPIVFGENSVA